MCGRYALTSGGAEISGAFALDEPFEFSVRFNLSPGQELPVVRMDAASGRRLAELRTWGLVPSWAKDPKIGNRMINARAETVAEKPSFRAAFKRRRCLVPASGFYEWKKVGDKKHPQFIHAADGGLFGMAGLYESWEDALTGEVIDSYTILTTDANQKLSSVHARMPVILARDSYERWLDPGVEDRRDVEGLLRPCPEDWVAYHEVSTHVNRPGNDDARCIEPWPPQDASAF